MLHRKRYGNCRSDGNRKVAFGDLYLMISTAAWKSLRKKRSAFSTVPTALTTARPSEIRGTKHNISFTPPRDRGLASGELLRLETESGTRSRWCHMAGV